MQIVKVQISLLKKSGRVKVVRREVDH